MLGVRRPVKGIFCHRPAQRCRDGRVPVNKLMIKFGEALEDYGMGDNWIAWTFTKTGSTPLTETKWPRYSTCGWAKFFFDNSKKNCPSERTLNQLLPKIQTLTTKFTSLFQPPHSLPPSRPTNHHVPSCFWTMSTS